ncbi:MAG: MFS transporter [Anaerolineae bacterium]|uniref:MFS transporter n=1 Tax=Candidatus Flexifilum breve TaxID=3140694 RepID=UPI001ACA3916|nr:MFS transporter [Chloroflexota bacterium]MBN8638942.1 MFS transporter [Anaerolineae bacterium]
MKKLDAFRVHLWYSGLGSFGGTLVWTAMMVYQVQIVGLTPLQLVLVGTTMEVTAFLFEIPTGIVADVYSRRLSTIIGVFLIGVAYLVEVSVPTFAALIIGNIIWSIGYTFTSGAYQAWLVDEVGQERAGAAFIRGGQVGRIAGLLGIPTAVALGTIYLGLPVIVGGLIHIVAAVYLVLFMPETGFTPTPAPDRNTFQKMGDTFSAGLKVIRGRPKLMSILAVGLFFGLFSEAWDRLWQAHLIRNFNIAGVFGLPTIWIFGIMDIFLMVIGFTGLEIMRRRLDTNNPVKLTRAVFWLTAVMVVGIIAYGLSPVLGVALIAWLGFMIARDLIGAPLDTWTNQHIDSNVRATVLSMRSQTDAIGQIVGGPPLGLIGQQSVRLAFIASGAVLSPALLILNWVREREKRGALIAEAEVVEVTPESN